MTPARSRYDVCVIGGGPVGCTSALAFARKGARVLVLEADPRACRRFAGEWIHPAGIGVLDVLRAGRLESASPRLGYGFVVFPSPGDAVSRGGHGTDPIELPYPDGVALSAPHEGIVSALRAVVRDTEGIEVVLADARAIEEQSVRGSVRGSDATFDIEAERVIGADGRGSFVRRQIGLEEDSAILSYMASVDLVDAELPFEGFGHVVLGGPGPVLLYRIGDGLVRGCFDVPAELGKSARKPGFVWESFRGVLPPGLVPAFRRGLERGTLRWAATRFRPRQHFGRGPVTLVGDAAGHVHPMTAIGLTMGFLDAQAAADHVRVEDYAARRRGYVPELLATALYHCFRRGDESARALRQAVFASLRANPADRRRTMQLLSADDERRTSFGGISLRVAAGAVKDTLGRAARDGLWRETPVALARLSEWFMWPAAVLVPSSLRGVVARGGSGVYPLAFLRPKAGSIPCELSSPPPRPAPAEAPSERHPRDVGAAITAVTERLIGELEGLAAQLGTTPDEVMAVPGLRMVRAITATRMRPGVAARMTIGRRWLARNGIPRLLEGRRARDAFTTLDLAQLLVVLLGGSTWDRGRIADLELGIEALLEAQTPSGAFTTRLGPPDEASDGDERADEHTTAMACLALGALRKSPTQAEDVRLAAAEARAARWLTENVTPEEVLGLDALRSRADAIEAVCSRLSGAALSAVEREALAPWVRRASAAVAADAVAREGNARTGGESAVLASSALGLRAVAMARDAAAYVLSPLELAALTRLSSKLVDEARRSGPFEAEDVWRVGSEVLATLTRLEASPLSARPHGAAPGEGAGSAGSTRGENRPAYLPSEEDWAFCRARLAEVSRSFAKPIALLPQNLEVAVTLAYLLCRIADTLEDHASVPGDARGPLLAKFIDVLHGRRQADGFVRAFEAVVSPRELPEGSSEAAELALTQNLSLVMRVFALQPEATRSTLTRWVSEMARGMALYACREPGSDGFVALETVPDLERYCYFVAGTVGHLLTDLFLAQMGEEATPEIAVHLRTYAEAFATGLQLVNILKDVTDDRERRWSYVPRTTCAARSLPIPELTDPARRTSAHDAVAPLFDIARRSLDHGMRYALAIPKSQLEVRRFCLLPLWMAARTLVLAQGGDAMFTPGAAVKIPREEVERLAMTCMAHAGDDDVLRANYTELWSGEPDDDQRSAG